MAYVTKKTVKGREYYQLVESRRVEGKPRQRVLAHLGEFTSLEAALEELPDRIESLRREAAENRERAVDRLDASESARGREMDKIFGRETRDEPESWRERIEKGESVPGPRRGISKRYANYWQTLDFAYSQERRAEKLARRLENLRAVSEELSAGSGAR